jgi:predicted nucleotidyltransferase
MLLEDLKKWFDEEWVRIDTQGNIAGDCGTMKSKKTPTRCLPKAKAQSLSKSERKATTSKKLAGGKKGKQFVANTKKAKVTRESVNIYETNLNSSQLKQTLAPEIFDDNENMKSEIRDRLNMISKEFIKFLDMPIMAEDIILTGSLANYNWSEDSDVDLHILVNFENFGIDKEVLKKYFDSKKTIWNSTYPITVKGYDVEMYVQDVNEVHTSTGIYSIKDDEWVTKPERQDIKIDLVKVREKANYLAKEIDALITSIDTSELKLDRIKKLKDKIKRYRKIGLETEGEYSYENLAFKYLRRMGYLKKLEDFKKYLITKNYTLVEKKDDRCTRIAKRKYEEWPSAYASGAVVKCRQGKIWKDIKEDTQQLDEVNIQEIQQFVDFCTNTLKADKPQLKLHTTSEFTDNNNSFGYYDPRTQEINISAHNRNLADVLRTIAHEMVHHKQNLKGILNINSGQDASPEENQANQLAGLLLRVYGRNNPHIYE